jgi:peroxiredoxin
VTLVDADPIAPPFSLPDARGNIVALDELRRAGGPVVVVFYRGHWCPYCRRYLAKLQANHARLLDRGATLVAISPEPSPTSARLARDLGLAFPLLSDPAGQVIDRYAARNRLTRRSTVLPHPAVFVIDPSGIVRFRSIDRDFKRRTTMHTIFSELNAVPVGR